MKRTTLIALAVLALICAPAIPSLASHLTHRHRLSLSATRHRPIVTMTASAKHTRLRTFSRTRRPMATLHRLHHLTRLHKVNRSARSMHVLSRHTVRTLSIRHRAHATVRLGHSTHKYSSVARRHNKSVL